MKLFYKVIYEKNMLDFLIALENKLEIDLNKGLFIRGIYRVH